MSLVKSETGRDERQKRVETAPPGPKPGPGKASSKRPNKKLYQPPQAAAAAASSSRPRSSPSRSPNTGDEKPAATVPSDDAEEGTWESLYDDAGDCLSPDLISDFKTALSLSDEEDIKFDTVTGDYSGFTLNDAKFDLTDNEYAHVLEVHGFAESLKTPDIFARISSVGSTDFDVVWVDDTHALLVFGSQVAANAALHCTFPDLKVRVLSQATRESKLKAKNCTERLLPFKKRPQTSLDAARRLVGRHLGLKVQVSQSQLQAERKVLQEAKDRRRQIRKQTNDVWEGNVN